MATPVQCGHCSGIDRHTLTCPETVGLWPCEQGRRWYCGSCSTTGDFAAVMVAGEPVCVGCGCHAAIEGET